jgi:hypothetical protein
MTMIAADEVKVPREDRVAPREAGTRMIMAGVTSLILMKTMTGISGVVIPINRKNILKMIMTMMTIMMYGEIMKMTMKMMMTGVKTKVMIITKTVIMVIVPAGVLAA